MPLGNYVVAFRSVDTIVIPNVSFFTDKYAESWLGLYVDYNLNGSDVVHLTRGSNPATRNGNALEYITTNKSSKNGTINFQYSADANATLGSNYNPTSFIKDYNNNKIVVENSPHNGKIIDAFGIETPLFFGADVGTKGYHNAGTGQFYLPTKMIVDSNNNLYLTDTGNHVIRKIVYDKTKAGASKLVVSTLAGPAPTTGTVNTITGTTDGNGSDARFTSPQGIAIDLDDNIYVADLDRHLIRKITTNGDVTTIAGSVAGYLDGIGTAAKFHYPVGLCCDFDGNIYVSDQKNNRIRKITPTTVGGITTYTVSTLAGKGISGIDNEGDYLDVVFTKLGDIGMQHDGNLLVVDNAEWKSGVNTITANRIKKIKNTTGYKTNFNITISTNRANIVLEDLLYRRGWDGKSPVTCNLTILSGVYVYGDRAILKTKSNVLAATPAFSIGSALAGSTITITNSGTIIGSGGTTSIFGTSKNNNGGDGLSVKTNIVLINHGVIGGGGGAGEIARGDSPDNHLLYAVGGGGAGFGLAFVTDPGTVDRNKYGTNGLILSGGKGGTDIHYIGTTKYSIVAGAGGNAGQDGNPAVVIGNINNGTSIPPTLAGKAVDGMSYITIDSTSTGSFSGARVN